MTKSASLSQQRTTLIGTEALQNTAGAMGILVSVEQAEALLQYAQLLLQWNRVYNLTAIKNPQEVITHHLLDSMSVIPSLQRQLAAQEACHAIEANQPIELLDVGSGGGLPGVVLTILCPRLRVTCVDAVAKKAAFVQQVAAQLPVSLLGGRLKAVHGRVEKLQTTYDVIASRAFASLGDFTQWSRQSLKTSGMWMAMKGLHPQQEMDVLPPWVQVFHVEQLRVIGLDAQRCVAWMREVKS